MKKTEEERGNVEHEEDGRREGRLNMKKIVSHCVAHASKIV